MAAPTPGAGMSSRDFVPSWRESAGNTQHSSASTGTTLACPPASGRSLWRGHGIISTLPHSVIWVLDIYSNGGSSGGKGGWESSELGGSKGREAGGRE